MPKAWGAGEQRSCEPCRNPITKQAARFQRVGRLFRFPKILYSIFRFPIENFSDLYQRSYTGFLHWLKQNYSQWRKLTLFDKFPGNCRFILSAIFSIFADILLSVYLNGIPYMVRFYERSKLHSAYIIGRHSFIFNFGDNRQIYRLRFGDQRQGVHCSCLPPSHRQVLPLPQSGVLRSRCLSSSSISGPSRRPPRPS